MATSLHLVRHGEPASIERCDSGLNENGRRQAEAVATRLADVGADVVLHSPKRRARETADIIAARLSGVPISSSDLADDRTPFPADRATVPEQYWPFLDGVPADKRDVDGHQLDAAAEVLGAVADDDRRVVVVTHAFVIGWFVRRALDAPTWRWLGLNHLNGAITTITYTAAGSRLVRFNDSGHLTFASG
jgi:probable phosphoglycerate mutase